MSWLPHPRALLLPTVLGLLLLALLGYRGWSLSQAKSLEDFGAAPSFALTDQFGRPLTLEELRGQIVVGDFIYTNCPDICPLLSLRMKELQERLRREQLLGTQVQLLSFTTDPARDTPAVLRDYAERYQADPAAWRFLSGPEDTLILLIVDGFHLGVQALPPEPIDSSGHDHGDAAQAAYEVMHSARFVLIDRQGRVRAWYDGRELEPDRIVADVRQLLR